MSRYDSILRQYYGISKMPANFIELHAVPVGEYSGEPLKIWIDPGNASSQEIANLLHALSQLHRAAGGEGLEWRIEAP